MENVHENDDDPDNDLEKGNNGQIVKKDRK